MSVKFDVNLFLTVQIIFVQVQTRWTSQWKLPQLRHVTSPLCWEINCCSMMLYYTSSNSCSVFLHIPTLCGLFSQAEEQELHPNSSLWTSQFVRLFSACAHCLLQCSIHFHGFGTLWCFYLDSSSPVVSFQCLMCVSVTWQWFIL